MYTKKAEKRGRIALARLALQEEKPLPKIKAEIQRLIDTTWETPTPELLELFPEGKPSPARFVGTLAEKVKEDYMIHCPTKSRNKTGQGGTV